MSALRDLISAYDEPKGGVGAFTDEAAALGVELIARVSERSGVDADDLIGIAHDRVLRPALMLHQVMIRGGGPENVVNALGGCWTDGFLVGVLWEQERALLSATAAPPAAPVRRRWWSKLGRRRA